MRTKLYLLIVVVSVGMAAWATYVFGKDAKIERQAWEYRIVVFGDPQPVLAGKPQGDMPEFNGLGAEGWELVAVSGERHGTTYLAYFKRRK